MKQSLTLIAFLFAFIGLAACAPEEIKEEDQIMIEHIVSSVEPIVPGEPFPPFLTHFETGATVIYSYVWLKNTETMTGSFPVRMRWFAPNDFRPPMAQREIELEPGQNVAQFSIHNEDGMPRGPYMLLARTGRKLSELTASGSSRLFVGMTEEESETFLKEEEEFRIARDAEMKRREEERKKQEEEEVKRKAEMGTGATMTGEGLLPGGALGPMGDVQVGEKEGTGAALPGALPPGLVGDQSE